MARNRDPRGHLTEGARNSKSAARTTRPAGGGAPVGWPRCTTADQGQLILPMNTSTHQLRVQLDVRTGVQVARRGAGAVSPVDLCGYLSRPHPSRGQLHPTAAYAAEPGATRRNSQSIASNDTPLDWVQPGRGGYSTNEAHTNKKHMTAPTSCPKAKGGHYVLSFSSERT